MSAQASKVEYATPVLGIERSQDRKLSTDSRVSATWVAQASCPDSCPFRGAGCYAETGRSGMHTRRINAAEAKGDYNALELARMEAQAIDGLSGKNPLRIHVVGDCKTVGAAKTVAAAAARYAAKHNQKVWTYTHATNVPRAAWGPVSILRSCQTMGEVKEAHKRGWATALVVAGFKSEKAYSLGDGFTGIPCPYQTGKTKSCVDCGLCLDDQKLRDRKLVILFGPDRGTTEQVKAALGVSDTSGFIKLKH